MRAMKVSGVEWIGALPETWRKTRVKHHFRVVNGATPKSDNLDYWGGDIVWVTPTDMKEDLGTLSFSNKTITEEGLNSCGTELVPQSSVILSNRAPIGKIGIAGVELCTNQGCKALVSIGDLHSKYLSYFLSIQTSTLNMLGRGTTFLELSTFDLSNFVCPFPSKDEQSRIVSFLDTKCAQIDAIIEKQQQVIEKLKAYKQSVITEAVTKGLDPTVPMKDSGVEWIGKIPESWNVGRIGMFSEFFNGDRSSKYPKPEDFVDDGVPFINSTNIEADEVDTTICKYISQRKYSELGGAKIKPFDIIFCLRGSVGKVAINMNLSSGTVASSLMAIRPIKTHYK